MRSPTKEQSHRIDFSFDRLRVPSTVILLFIAVSISLISFEVQSGECSERGFKRNWTTGQSEAWLQLTNTEKMVAIPFTRPFFEAGALGTPSSISVFFQTNKKPIALFGGEVDKLKQIHPMPLRLLRAYAMQFSDREFRDKPRIPLLSLQIKPQDTDTSDDAVADANRQNLTLKLKTQTGLSVGPRGSKLAYSSTLMQGPVLNLGPSVEIDYSKYFFVPGFDAEGLRGLDLASPSDLTLKPDSGNSTVIRVTTSLDREEILIVLPKNLRLSDGMTVPVYMEVRTEYEHLIYRDVQMSYKQN